MGVGAMSIFGILKGRDIKMRFKNRNFAVSLPGKKMICPQWTI